MKGFGYQHILAYEHVLGADPVALPNWSGPYDINNTFHEPLVLYGFITAITSLKLVTGIIVTPQRLTTLLTKQAAEVDILTAEGRFRLGLGIDWNSVEYEALGQDFTTRQRVEEQIGLLRRLWTERVVNHDGRFDRVNSAGLLPAPLQRPIPIWPAPGPRRPSDGSRDLPMVGSPK